MGFSAQLKTPFGLMHLAVDDAGVLTEAWLPNTPPQDVRAQAPTANAAAGMRVAQQQFMEYFTGRRRAFELRFDPRGGSAFERAVWASLCTIPYGKTTSYGAIAAQLGLTNGARAVGRANGANPIPIVIPCHRVIGADGALTGYGGGLPLKRALLELEGALGAPPPRLFSAGP